MAHIHSIHMIILAQTDLDAAVTYYQQLGFKQQFHMRGKWAEFELSGVKIGLCPTSKSPDQLVRTGIVLQVDDLPQFYTDFQGKIEFLSDPAQAAHGIMVSFKDPGGNVIDVYQPTPDTLKELVRKAAESGQDGNDCCQKEGESAVGCCKNARC